MSHYAPREVCMMIVDGWTKIRFSLAPAGLLRKIVLSRDAGTSRAHAKIWSAKSSRAQTFRPPSAHPLV